jgi:spore coat protein U-like protein
VTRRSNVTAFALWFLLFGLAAKSANPATASASFGVSVVVQASCQASPTRESFRTYAAALANAALSVSVSCTLQTPYNISVSTDTTAPDVPMLQLAAANLAAPSLALLSDPRKTFNWKLQSTAGNASGRLSLHEADPPYTIDGSSAYPGMVTVIITY